MKFRDYVIKDKLLNKGTKRKRLRECSDSQEYEVNGEELSLTSIIKIITGKIESTECPLLKTRCMLDIIYLLMSHLERSLDGEGDDDGNDDDEILIEKK